MFEQHNYIMTNNFSPLLTDPVKKSHVARWFTGCYINEEDECFEKKISNSFGSFDVADTENISDLGARAVPLASSQKVAIVQEIHVLVV